MNVSNPTDNVIGTGTGAVYGSFTLPRDDSGYTVTGIGFKPSKLVIRAGSGLLMLYDSSVSTSKYWRGGSSDAQISLGNVANGTSLNEITEDGFKMRLPSSQASSSAVINYIAIK